jgi:hypothetical protein
MDITVHWDVTSSNLVRRYRSFDGLFSVMKRKKKMKNLKTAASVRMSAYICHNTWHRI